MLKGACIFGQSGGPTSVINASAFGVIDEAFKNPNITRVLCAAHGIKGILNEQLYDMAFEAQGELEKLPYTPSSAFGSCRYKLADFEKDDTDYKKILEVFKKHDVRYFFYNGGNDSMDTCNKISKYMEKVGYECCIIGVPKTIDNDLFGTDHCPGFGSAAKYIATSCMEVYHDARVYDTGTIIIMEIMGRNAGWLTAASAVATHMGAGPDLIYMPEKDFDLEKAVSEIADIYNKTGNCFVALSEGVKDKDGVFLAEYAAKDAAVDAFGHKQMGGAAAYLASVVKERTKAKTRAIELSLLQRCAAHCASLTDINEAVSAGRKAVQCACEGTTDKMIAFERAQTENGKYQLNLKSIPLTDVANTEKKFPLEWITPSGNSISRDFLPYVLPLIEGETNLKWEYGVPRFARLNKVLVK